jgi:D-alanine-D-alanine ligase-like ATP-grasp enzyme
MTATVPRLRVCVMQPDYAASAVDYRHYDPPRDLAPWLPDCDVHHEMLDKRTVFRQLRACAARGFDVYVNLCEGYLDWDVPSIDVIHALDRLELPYTGPSASLYDPSKPLMKYVAYSVGVATPPHVEVPAPEDAAGASFDWQSACDALPLPLFVKPAHAGDSLGIDAGSVIHDRDALTRRVESLRSEYGPVLVERYIDGREFTVLVLGALTPRGAPRALRPVEYQFPTGTAFKTYALKTSALHPSANVPVSDEPLAERLRDAASRIFAGFGGVGYARCDFRLAADGTLYFLEINFTCSIGYPEGSEGSADFIVRYDGIGHTGFLTHIIAEARARHARRRRKWERRGNAISGYGIVARNALQAGDVVFPGEESTFRLVSQRHVRERWSEAEQQVFRQYAWPLSNDVSVLWDAEADQWAPQNHSCDPNTRYDGLDVIACRDIAAGEELTIDYATFCGPDAEPFDCRCGSPNCRGSIGHREHRTECGRPLPA